MNKILTALLIGLAVGAASLAAAQDEPTAEFTPEWSAFPTSPAYYPTRAIERGLDGSAVLCCRALDDGSLTCRIDLEAPSNMHFGQAAMLMTRSMRLTPTSTNALAAARREVELTVNFQVLEGRGRRGRSYVRTRNGSWRVDATGFCEAPPLS